MRAEQHLFLAWREHRLINAINQVVFELDESGHWRFLNAAWAQLSGYPAAGTIGAHFCGSFHNDDQQAAEAVLADARDGNLVQTQLRLQTRSGQPRWVDVNLRRAASENGSTAALIGTLTDASRQKHTEQRLRQQIDELLQRGNRQLSFSMQVAREFASGKPLDELYGWFVRSLKETFGYHRAEIFHFNNSGETATLIARAGHGGPGALGSRVSVIPGEDLLGKALLAHMKRGLNRRAENGDGPAAARIEGTPGDMAVPIIVSGEVLGALAVYGEAAHEFDADDTLLLEGLAGQLATAIASVQLRQEMEERMAELDNLQQLMRREAWLRAHDTYARDVRGYRFDQRLLQAAEASGSEIHTPVRSEAVALDAEQRIHVSPLQIRGEMFGSLGVEDDPEDPLTGADLELLDAISQQVAEALENARLLEQTQKRAVELETVSRVSTATSTILDKDKLLQGVVELTQRSFNLYHAHVYLLDEKQGDLVLAAGSGDAGAQMVQEGWRIELDHPRSIVARAARARKGIIVNDVRKETGFLPNPLLPATRSELAAPMISGNRLLGVLDVQSDMANYFTEDDVRIQSALAGQVATALQNATLYQEQLETTEKLREFDRLKSEFLASMSHELRTPLNSIIGFADVLLEGIDGELNERMREDVQLIRNSGQHLRELIGDILDMSKIEAGMMELRYEEIAIPALRQEIEGFARTQLIAYDKDLDFKMQIGPDVGCIEADRTRFKQVLFNLVSNAIKFTAEGEVTLAMSVEDDKLHVRVEDTGIGIQEENIPIIFEQFRQIDGSLTRTAGGTGLGLPISRSLVELHGGAIWVESNVGEGTAFYFTVPLKRALGGSGGKSKETTL